MPPPPDGSSSPEAPRPAAPSDITSGLSEAALELALEMVHPAGAVDVREPAWFKRAVFYEVMVRSFCDSAGDGIGDLAGLTSKLDYLSWLGVDCLWLPPFFSSPLADGGYDISDYRSVLPELGTLEEFGTFIDKAHDAGLRIIIDFVANHTSDQHPWFQASKKDPTGPYGDFYVWRDTDELYRDARIIFLDTETSNWTWDATRGQYYWHRFYSHQPDLNYENRAVVEEIKDAIRFWLAFGIDGFRLDAVPYLIEEDGTNCENLPATHAVLKQLRAMVDREFPGRILLCEANQWPAEVVEYFGDDDECHMAFHFPVMPRLYMALKQQSRASVSAILAQTPAIPPGCQWGTFLRNHDELTLEMVTPQERDWMWSQYAPEPRMRSNLGVRRRLAPLLDNDPATIRLLHGLLLSLPGSPVLYYGDEIGMGDNIWLHDRDGVRTPMQWDRSPGAGFSSAEPSHFYLPLIEDAEYSPARVNVEDQLGDPTSLLVWLHNMLNVRRRWPVFGTGDFVDLGGESVAVLSFLRREDDTVLLCLNNFAASEQVAALSLPEFAGQVPANLLRDERLDPVGAAGEFSYPLPAHGFAWLHFPGTPQEDR